MTLKKVTFQPGDKGPFYSSPEQQEERREDKLVPDKMVKKKLEKEELIKHLHELGIETGGTLKKLQELCKQHNFPTEVIEQKIVEGWEGKQKGVETERAVANFNGKGAHGCEQPFSLHC